VEADTRIGGSRRKSMNFGRLYVDCVGRMNDNIVSTDTDTDSDIDTSTDNDRSEWTRNST